MCTAACCHFSVVHPSVSAAQRFTYCAEGDRIPTARNHDAEMSQSLQGTQFVSFYCYLRYNTFQSLLHRWAWPHSDLIKKCIYSVPPGRSRDPGGCCGSGTKGSAYWWPPGYWRWEIAQFRSDSVWLRNAHEYKLYCWIFPLTGPSAFTSTLDNPSNIMDGYHGTSRVIICLSVYVHPASVTCKMFDMQCVICEILSSLPPSRK